MQFTISSHTVVAFLAFVACSFPSLAQNPQDLSVVHAGWKLRPIRINVASISDYRLV